MGEANEFIIDITEDNVQTALLEKSNSVPVLIDIWADWCQPCQTLTPVLERLVAEYQGRFILAKINADEQQNLAAQLQVRSLPTLKLIVQGQIVGELLGVQPESEIRALLDPYVGEPQNSLGETAAMLEQVDALCQAGEFQQAAGLLKAAIEAEPSDESLKVRYARLLLNMNALEDAQTIINSLGEEIRQGELGKQFYGQLYFAQLLLSSPGKDQVVQRIAAGNSDAEALYYLAAHQVMDFESHQALDTCWQLFSQHRHFSVAQENDNEDKESADKQGDSAGKQSLLALFDLLGKQDAKVGEYRRKLFNLLH